MNFNVTKLNKHAILRNNHSLNKYTNSRGLIDMKNSTTKLSAIAVCMMFASMQIASATIDTGLNNAVINNATGGFAGVDTSVQNTATLNFTGNSHVNWNTLNVANGETLNFNAINGASGLTVINTVNSGMSQIYGAINANDGIAKLIISNPNGMLYNGSNFTTAGDVMLTTQPITVDANYNVVGLNQAATEGVTLNNATFNVGGQFNITAPTIEAVNAAVKAANGFRMVTQDGQNYLVCPTTSNDAQHTAVRMESVSVDGDVYIVSGKDIVKTVNGGEIKGNLNVQSDGNVAFNYVDDYAGLDAQNEVIHSGNHQQLHVTGDTNIHSDGRVAYLKNAKIDGNLDMSNSGGFLEVSDINVANDANLTTTVASNNQVKHFVHVIGDNEIGGNLNIDSIHNIHVGGYNMAAHQFHDGNVNVGGNLNALAREGSVTVTVDTQADKINLESGTLNILTDGNAKLTANEYNFKANKYIGGISSDDYLINVMENYIPLPVATEKAFVQIEGGNVNKIETAQGGYAFIRSNGNMNVNGVNADKVNLAANQSDIVIGDNVQADTIVVDGETRNLTVALPARNYRLKYTDIKDNSVLSITGDTEITYDMANGDNGWNNGVQTADNTYLVVPGPGPQPPVNPPSTPDLPTQDNDNVKILNNLLPDQVATAIDAGQVYTPIAFAADLDEEEDKGVRKNVDGSVTVVRPFTPSK